VTQAEVVRQLLLDLGVCDDEYPCRAFVEEDQPDNHVTITNTSAKRENRLQSTGVFRQMPGFQVRVRGEDETVCMDKAEQIREALATEVRRTHVTVDAMVFLVHCVSQLSEVLDNGYEGNTKRHIATLNGVLSYREL
jgi:hypothetical protein